MPDVPEYNFPKKDFGKWVPDKHEKFNMRYWKAKKAKPQRHHLRQPTKKTKPNNRVYGEQISHIKSILSE